MPGGEQIHFGIKWVAISRFAVQGSRFAANVVLARLLVPEMFGLVAMANVAITVLGVFREMGMGSAYVQRQNPTSEADLVATNTTFYLAAGLNVVLFAASELAAPWIAVAFQSQEVEPVLRWMFVSFLFDALLTGPQLVLRKKLEFGRLATSEIASSIALAGVAIGLALLGFGVWSLVAGQLASKVVLAIALYWTSGWRPRWIFDPGVAWELFAFGKYVWGFAVLSVISGSVDRALTGRWLGAGMLGVYTIAFNLSMLPTRQITSLVNQVSFPALSQIQHDKAALRRACRKALAHVSILSLPVGFGMLAVSEDLVLTVYGERWIEAVDAIEVLAFYGVVLSVSAIQGPVLMAIGKPRVMLFTSIVHNALLVTLLSLLGRFGLVGICYAVLLPVIVSSFISYVLVIRYLEFRIWELLEPLSRATAATLVMYAAVEACQYGVLPGDLSVPVSLASSVLLGVAVYLASTALFNRVLAVEFASTVRSVLGAKGGLV